GLALAVMASRAQAWMGGLAGSVAATSLAVGMETVPFVVLAIALYGLMWAAFPQEAKGGAQAFALSFPLFTLVHFFIATAPAQYAVVACDVVSLPYTVGALLAGAALLGATLIGARMPGIWTRFALVAGLG